MKVSRHVPVPLCVSSFCHRVNLLSSPRWTSASFEHGRRFKACPLGDLTGGRTEITHTEPISDYWRNDDS
jgi:hypothetical protein